MGTAGMDMADNKDKETKLQVLPAEKSGGRISCTGVCHTIAADFAAEFLVVALSAAAQLLAVRFLVPEPFADFLVHLLASCLAEQAYTHFSCLDP